VTGTPAIFSNPSNTRMSSAANFYTRWRYRLIPDHVLGEILAKPWIDNAIPALMLVLVLLLFQVLTPLFFSTSNLTDLSRVLGEYLFVALGMAVVMLAGGIDLSVGSTFALCNFLALALVYKLGWTVPLAMAAVLVAGAAIGLVNGVLIGYLRLRAFLTTLVVLIIIRAVVDLLVLRYASGLSSATAISGARLWDFLGDGTVLGIASSLLVALCVAAFAHVFLTRLRIGWHILAVGGSRRSAHNAGISVRRTVCLTYVLSGLLTAAAALFFASRLGSASAETGVGLEVAVVTAVVLGGISLGGGRGSVMKALLGTMIVIAVTNGLIRLGMPSGASTFVLGLVMLFAVIVDVRWTKNRAKVLTRAYVSPTYFSLPPSPSTDPASTSAYAINDRLHDVEAIGLDEVDGPEDIVLDRDDNLYCGSRHGNVVRFFAPDYKRWEVYAHIGGHPLGMAIDALGNVVTCVGGMGLYKITPEREVIKLSDETNRTLLSVIDDSRMRLADDLDIAPDGRIFFSEATIRYELSEWMVDALECRGNGRIICYDPRDGSSRTVIPNLVFANGICMATDGQSFFFAETWACRISRYWFDGPKKGRLEVVIANLPGYPDNINRASDGTYWCALVGMRSPVFDLAMTMPQFRRRMVYRVAPDSWLYPNMNTGCVIKFDANGNVLESLWDLGGKSHPQITSIREHKGYLYLGGVYNNRIGRYRIPGANPLWTGPEAYWSPNP
jgi:ribose transport system permease protein